jgi:hypothetical protein
MPARGIDGSLFIDTHSRCSMQPSELDATRRSEIAGDIVIQPKQARAAKYKYARQIKKAADGRRCCVGSQAGKAFEIQPERRFKADGKINVGATAQRIRPDETKKATIEKEVM